MKITIRDKIILAVLAAGAVIYGGTMLLIKPANAKIQELKPELSEAQKLISDITPLEKMAKDLAKERDELAGRVENAKTVLGSYTATNKEFLLFLGQATSRNNVEVITFNELGESKENGIYRSVFDFEMEGETDDINKVISEIDGMGIKYSIGSMSFRQNEAYDYLMRFYDRMTRLEWYEEPEEDEDKKEAETTVEIPDILPTIPDSPGVEIIPDEFPKLEVTPTPEPAPTIEATQEPTKEPEPTPTPEPEDINDRLSSLLQGIANREKANNGVILLSKNNGYAPTGEMRLAVTLCLVMFNEPTPATSFLARSDAGNGIL